MPTFLEYNTGNSVYVSSTTGRLEYSGTVPPDPTILPDAAILLQQIDTYAAEIDVDAPWAHPRAAEWDAMTLERVHPRATRAQPRRRREPDRVLDPARLRRRPRRSSRSSSRSGTSRARATSARRHVLPQLRHRERRPGAPLRRRLAAGAAPAGQAARRHRRPARAGAPDRAARPPGARAHRPRHRRRAKRVIVAAPPPLVLDIDWFPRLPDPSPRAARAPRHGPADEVRRGLRDAVLARRPGSTASASTTPAPPAPSSTTRPRTASPACCWPSSAAPPGAPTARCAGRSAARPCSRASPRCSASRRCTRSSTPSTTGPRSAGPRGGPTAIHAAAAAGPVRPGDPPAVRPGALGRHRDLDVLVRLHGRRRPLRRARRARGPGAAVDDAADCGRARHSCSVLAGAGRRRAGATPRAASRREVGARGSSPRCRRRASRPTSTSTPTAASTPAPTSPATHSARGSSSGRARRHAAAVVDRARPAPRRRPRRPGRQPDPRRQAGPARDLARAG